MADKIEYPKNGTVDADGKPAVPDGWTWTRETRTCPHCGATYELDVQPPEWLALPEGVTVECPHCAGRERLGGFDVKPGADLYVVECGGPDPDSGCSSTFLPSAPDIDRQADGTWTCPNCGTVNRDLNSNELVLAEQTGVKS